MSGVQAFLEGKNTFKRFEKLLDLEAFKLLLEAKNNHGSPRLAITIRTKNGVDVFAKFSGVSSAELLEKYGEEIVQFYLGRSPRRIVLGPV